MNNYIHWYYNEDAKEFFKDLLQDINKQTKNPLIEWVDSCYHNDACGSVCFNLDNNGEKYVQLWSFHNEHEANREDMLQYLVSSYINGKEIVDSFYITNDRNEAINKSIESANNLLILEA